MNIKNILKNLKTNKAKAFFLAGLMGIAPSCKVDDREPDFSKSDNAVNSEHVVSTIPAVQIDSFMKHVPNAEDLKIRTTGEDEWAISFITDGYDVIGMRFADDPNQTGGAISYPIEFDRTVYGLKDSASFIAKPYWNYWVSLPGGDKYRGWEICGITDAEYVSKYQGLSDAELANIAKNHLEKNNANPGYIDYIYNAVAGGQGEWSYFQGKKWLGGMKVKSYGQNIGLQSTDILRLVFADENGQDSFSDVFSAMDDQKTISKDVVPSNTVFYGSAYADVNKQMDDDTDIQKYITTDSAKLIIDAAKNETIVMPFKDWYTVTIIRSGDQIISRLSDLPASATEWAVEYPDINSVYEAGNKIQNGLWVSTSYTSLVYGENVFVSVKEPHDAAPGELTAKTVLNNKGVYSSLSTNYFKGKQQDATGLNEVHCSPARPRMVSSENQDVNEVIVQGTRHDFTEQTVIENWYGDGNGDEYLGPLQYQESNSVGIHFGFVFGGVRQR